MIAVLPKYYLIKAFSHSGYVSKGLRVHPKHHHGSLSYKLGPPSAWFALNATLADIESKFYSAMIPMTHMGHTPLLSAHAVIISLQESNTHSEFSLE
jgi:hypothetical protein